MNKYRKSLLSVVAAAAISSSMLSAEYLPLTTTSNDATWILFGVNGIAGTSTSGGNAGEFSISNDSANIWIDTDVNGLPGTDNSLGSVELISGSAVELRVDVSGYTAQETDPVRTIYVVDDLSTTPIFSFSYKAALEGAKLEYKIGTNSVQYITIDSTNTYSDPADGTETLSTEATSGGASLDSLSDVTKLAIDYNLTNNPPQSSQYSIASYQDLADANDSLRMYSFDAANETWKLFDTDNTINDFNTIEKGKGYWAKLDTTEDNSTANASGQFAGLVLGSGSISASDYENVGLAYDKWNLISFDNSAPQIRVATTGLILTLDATQTGDITITDASANNSVTVTVAASTTLVRAKQINYEIHRAKVFGTLPRVFDLKAFPVSATQLILMSNKKFGIEDDASNDIITAVSTIAGKKTWNFTDTADLAAAGDPAATKTIQSVYGEYSLIVEPLTGAGTASFDGNVTRAEVVTQDSSGIETSKIVDIQTDLTTSTTNLAAAATNGLVTYEVDVDQNGTADYTLMAAQTPFYLRDATASRVFKFITTGTANVVDIDGLGAATTSITGTSLADTNATDTAATLNGLAGVIAAASGDNVIVIAPSADGTSSVDFTVKHISGGDNLIAYENGNPIVENTDLDKGSIGSIYAPNVFIKADTISSLDINVSSIVGVSDQNVTLVFTTISDQNLTGTEILSNVIGDASAFKSAFTTNIGDLNLTTSSIEVNGDILTIKGTDIIAVYADINTTTTYEVNSTNGLGFVQTANLANLVSDLKFNSVYTPNYVTKGPLYTLRGVGAEGYKLSALVTGYTHLGDETVTWESVDLTRPTKDWLLSQDYNLFDTDERAGYWAYLEHPIASVLAIDPTTASLSASYNTYVDGVTSTNYFSGTLEITVSGISQEAIDGDAVRVIASVGGSDIEMTRTSTTSITNEEVYTAKINLQELTTTPITGAEYPIDIKVYDGIGGTLAVDGVKTIDNLKPVAPAVTQVANGISIAPVADATKYYVFSGLVPEKYLEGTTSFLARFDNGGEANGLCAASSAVSISSSADSVKVVAVDGTGIIGAANVSDVASTIFMAIGKDRVVLSDYNDAGDVSLSTGGVDYNTSCEATATYSTNDNGIALASYTADVTAKVAYAKETLVSNFGAINSLYVSTGSASENATARIDYTNEYIGKEVFILIRETITSGQDVYQTYGITFPSIDEAAATSDTSPRVLLIGEQFTGVNF